MGVHRVYSKMMLRTRTLSLVSLASAVLLVLAQDARAQDSQAWVQDHGSHGSHEIGPGESQKADDLLALMMLQKRGQTDDTGHEQLMQTKDDQKRGQKDDTEQSLADDTAQLMQTKDDRGGIKKGTRGTTKCTMV